MATTKQTAAQGTRGWPGGKVDGSPPKMTPIEPKPNDKEQQTEQQK